VTEVARILLDGHLHRVVVTDGPEILGIITPFDLLRAMIERPALAPGRPVERTAQA